MPEKSTTPDLVKLTRRCIETGNRRDFDAAMRSFAPDVVWELMETAASFEGVAVIRGFLEDFIDPHEEYRAEPEEILDLGNGVMFSVIVQQGRPVGSTAHVQGRFAGVTTWVDGLIVHNTTYTDIDEARAVAERLAESRR